MALDITALGDAIFTAVKPVLAEKQATQAVLLTIEGIGLITAQQAINAAIGAVREVVNKALGFALL